MVGLVELVVLALAEAQEGGHPVVDLVVDLGVVLVAVVAREQQLLVVVGAPGAGGRGKLGRAPFARRASSATGVPAG